MSDEKKELPKEAYEGHERTELPLEKILVDETFNIDPARSRDEEIVSAMADAIRLQGLLEPLVVCVKPAEGPTDKLAHKGHRFYLLAGFIRHAALNRLGYKVAPVVVKRDVADVQQLLINGSENASRRQVHPYCMAKRFKLLRDHYKMSAEEIGKHHSYTPTYVEMLIRTYDKSIPEIRDGFFKNLTVDESRVPPFMWLQENAKRTPEEQKEAYERKYGKLRDERGMREADEGEPEIEPERKVRPKRRSVDAILATIDKDLLEGAPVELNLAAEVFRKDPKLSYRERIIAKAFLWWAADAKKAYPLRRMKVAEAPSPRASRPLAQRPTGARNPSPATSPDEDDLPGELEDA